MEKWCIQHVIDKELTYVIDIDKEIVRIYSIRRKRRQVGCNILHGKWASSFSNMLMQNEFLLYSNVSFVFDVDIGKRVNDKENKNS